jgi:hypothetical protein
MGRLNLSDVVNEEVLVNENPTVLDTLIPSYAANKSEMDSYKKVCESQNAEIKQAMKELGKTEYSAGGYVAKYIVIEKEGLNEDRLMEVLKKHGVTDVIKTKEYVDMDALEKYLYNAELSDEMAADMDSCREVSQTVQLRLSKEKKKKEAK